MSLQLTTSINIKTSDSPISDLEEELLDSYPFQYLHPDPHVQKKMVLRAMVLPAQFESSFVCHSGWELGLGTNGPKKPGPYTSWHIPAIFSFLPVTAIYRAIRRYYCILLALAIPQIIPFLKKNTTDNKSRLVLHCKLARQTFGRYHRKTGKRHAGMLRRVRGAALLHRVRGCQNNFPYGRVAVLQLLETPANERRD